MRTKKKMSKTTENSDRQSLPESKESCAVALYVATDLSRWETRELPNHVRDIGLYGVCYRRLEPEYYAWLRSRMNVARKAHAASKLTDSSYQKLCGKFNAVHAWAVEHIGHNALSSAVKSFKPKGYAPPSMEALGLPADDAPRVRTKPAGFLFPQNGDWRFTHPVTPEAVAKVDAIREKALACGWTEAQLYQNRSALKFPFGEDYGLVCSIEKNKRIGEICKKNIEIINTRTGSHLRFYNRKIEQPWLKLGGTL